VIGKYHLGYTGKNREELEYEIVEYKHNKDLTIKFISDGHELETTGAYLSKGLPLHPTINKPKVGDRFPCKNGDTVEIVEYKSCIECRIKWLSDGYETTRTIGDIRLGINKHPTQGIPQVGDVYKMRKGTIEVLNYKNNSNILVKFEDGTVVKTNSLQIRNRSVGHPTSYLVEGQKFTTTSGWSGTIVKYDSCYSVLVEWQDGSREYHRAGDIVRGGIKPPYQPSVAGVGFFGLGRFDSGLKRNSKEHAPDEILQYWKRMIVRCFDPKEVMKQSSKNYLNVEICRDWFNFQNFAEWAIVQPNWNCSNELDKDLLGNGYEYSPENCTFLPAEVNIFLADQYKREVHELPKGVQYLKPGTAGAKVGYVARCRTDKGREYLGYFDDPLEAFKVYKVAKERYAKILAERYKDRLTEKAYEKLKTFTVEP
jgi:hypothetical protein